MTSLTRKAISAPNSSSIAIPLSRKSRLPSWLSALLRNPISIAGALIILFFALVPIFAPLLAPPRFPDQPYLMPRSGFAAQPQAPSAAHPFGTTQGQYDIYYGLVWGTRTAFKVGLLITGLTVIIGGLLGAISAYAGGWVDEIIQRIVEIVIAFPFLLATLTMAIVLAPRLQDKILSAEIALVAFSWPNYARLIRGDVLAIKQRDFVLSARVIGSSNWRILFRHILPNSIYSLLVVASLDIGTYVLSFAALSFLGIGAGEGYADWGQLISLARNWIPSLAQYWYIVVYPGGALVLYVLGWNLLGDAFRDALDPKLRGQR